MAVVLMALLASSAPPPTLEHFYAKARAVFDGGDDALPILDAALALAGNRNDETVWRLRVLRAKALLRHGNPSKALADVSPPLPPALADSDVAIDRLLILMWLSTKPDSSRYFEQARHIAATKHPKRLGEVLFVHARTERELNEALRAAKRSGDVATEAKILGQLGVFVAGEGRFDEAIDFAERARRLIGDRELTFLHRTEGNLGWYYNELGDLDSAEEHLRNAVVVAAKVHAEGNRAAYLLQLGQTEMSRGDLAAARRDFVKARDIAVALGLPPAGALIDIATVELLDGHATLARQINESAKPTPDVALQSRILAGRIDLVLGSLDEARDVLLGVIGEAKTKAMRWEAESWLAEVYAARHEARQADEHFRAAIATVDEARSDIDSDELRLSIPDVASQLYDSYIEFLVEQHRDVDALRVTELNRARTLTEELKPESDERFEPVEKVRAAQTVALSYRLGRARSFLWVITSAGVQRFDLPPAETIQRTVNDYVRSIAQRRTGPQGKELYRMLVAPASGLLRGVSDVAIVPDGRLAALNFETLVNPATHRYWIEDVTIESAPSLRLLSPARNGAGSGRLLLMENAQPPDRTLLPLQYAAEELRRVRSHFSNVTALAGAEATPRAYVAAGPEKYAFIHFVAHGVATQQRPLDSAIVLASDRTGYKLYAREILAHRLNARLVTISSCFGAGRRAYQGEGLVGLAWAFLGAGAHEVIAALWEVNDRATPDLMDAMYTAIRNGRDPVDALRIAKLKLLHSKTIYAKPFYWATFVVYTGA